jgi:hypothetical protein
MPPDVWSDEPIEVRIAKLTRAIGRPACDWAGLLQGQSERLVFRFCISLSLPWQNSFDSFDRYRMNRMNVLYDERVECKSLYIRMIGNVPIP